MPLKAGLKIIFAIAVSLSWYLLNGEDSGELSLMIFFFLAFILLAKPISFQSPEKREDYIQQLKRSYERQMDLKNKQKEEKRRLIQATTERSYRKTHQKQNDTSLLWEDDCMEVILIVGAAVVLIYLYYTLQEYLKNPLKSFPTPSPEPVEKVPEIYTLPDPLEVLKSSEQGVVVGLIAQFERKLNANALSDALLEIFLKDLSQMGTETRNLEELKKLYASEDLPSLESLCTQFLELAHGEYKKRVKLVEFLLVLAYSDGVLGEAEKEALIDVGAFLRLENADFNQLYEGFEQLSLQSMELSPERASEILGTSGNPKSSFEDKVNQNHLNILDPKTWNKSYIPDRMQTLWELQQAYNTLQNAPTKVSLTKNHWFCRFSIQGCALSPWHPR